MASFSDNFDRADGGLGPNWQNNLGENGAGLQIVSQEVNSDTIGDRALARVNPSTVSFADDQESQITVDAIGSSDDLGVAVRIDNLGNGYIVATDGTDASDRTIYRIDNGTTLTNLGGGSIGPVVAGDVIKLEAIGDVLTVYVNDVQQVQVTDGTYTGGQPGMYYDLDNLNVSRIDDFSATDGEDVPGAGAGLVGSTGITTITEV